MDWLSIVQKLSISLSLLATATAIFISLWQLKLKIQSERRLKESAKVEMDINLFKLFTEIMDIANARRAYTLSEKAVEYILRTTDINKEKIEDQLFKAMIVSPVGAAAQNAAICAIYTLGKNHKMLNDMAKEALKSLVDKNKMGIAKLYLEKL